MADKRISSLTELAAAPASGDLLVITDVSDSTEDKKITIANLFTSVSITTSIAPLTSDSAALGSASLMWSDLFLASGAVINFNNGDVTLTHSSNALTVAGGSFITENLRSATTGTHDLGASTGDWLNLYMSTGGWIRFNNTDVVIKHFTNTLSFEGASSGYQFDALVVPNVSDGAALGSASLMWSDLFLASGSVINFNNGDVTITHSANTLAFAGASSGYSFDAQASVSVAGNGLRVVNTADSASVQVAKFEGDRATMADNDEAYISLMLSNDAGTQTEFGRVWWKATDVNAGTSEDGNLGLTVMNAGSLRDVLILTGSAIHPGVDNTITLGTTSKKFSHIYFADGATINWDGSTVILASDGGGAAQLTVTAPGGFVPVANDGAALGTTSLKWSDLFLASGAVINFNNGDVTVTHSANTLTFTGASSGYSFDAPLILGQGSTAAGELRLLEDTDDGSNYSAFRGSARSGNIVYTMPTTDPTAGQVLTAGAPSGGVSALSWGSAGSGGGDLKVLIPPGIGVLNGATNTNANSFNEHPTITFPDSGSTSTWKFSLKVPKGATSISAIKVLYVRADTGNLYLRFTTAHFDYTSGDSQTQDTSDTLTTYAGGANDNTLGLITVPSGAYNGFSVTEDDVIAMQIIRDTSSANDTYAADWRVIGVMIEFA